MQPEIPRISQLRQETNYWPTVKTYLQSPGSVPEPEVSCPICYVEIAIRGLPSQTPCPWKISEGSQKVGVVLPCAHILCQDCCESHIDRLDYQNLPLTCPICRFEMRHEGCGHMITAKRLPLATYEKADMVPLTLVEMPAEGKEGLPTQCLPCLRSTALQHLSWSLSHVMQFVRPTSANAHGEWDCIADNIHSMVSRFVNNQKMGPNWEFMASSDVSLKVAFVDDVDTIGELPPEIRYSAWDKIVVVPENEDDQAYWLVPCARSSRLQ